MVNELDSSFDLFCDKDNLLLDYETFFDPTSFINEDFTMNQITSIESDGKIEMSIDNHHQNHQNFDSSLMSCDEDSSHTKSPSSPESHHSGESIKTFRKREVDSVCSTSDSDETDQSVSSNNTSKISKCTKKRKRASPAEQGDKAKRRREANRISAAASRERKKMYVKELEARVKDMENEKACLLQSMSVTQMENERLRLLIEKLANGKIPSDFSFKNNVSMKTDIMEPSHKRRKIEEQLPCSPVILPDLEDAKLLEKDDNPFNISFWDRVPGKAVMFAMIFCIAMFVGFSGQSSDLFYGGHTKQASPVRVGRRILTSSFDDGSIPKSSSIVSILKPSSLLEKAHTYVTDLFSYDEVHQFSPTNDIAHTEF